jgi:eukaryotic-like serine/threonine-protein kinase
VPFSVPIEIARAEFPSFEFVSPLTPSEQKAAFHVRREGKDFCLKIISPSYGMDRLQREVLAMQAIDHPNVVRLVEYEFSARQGAPKHYLIEEFVAGTDLSDALEAGRQWPLDRIISFFRPLCDGLEELAKRNIVHRDLKPSNIRIRTDGLPVIIDFGLARHLDMSSLTNTGFGARIGTPKYFAPEQFLGVRRDIDHRTDLYALGVLMYEAAVGAHPSLTSQTMTIDELSQAVCESDGFTQVKEFGLITPRLQSLIKRLLAKERSRRPSSAGVVANLLSSMEATP